MKRVAVFLRKDQLAKLEEFRKFSGMPKAEAIRRAVDEFLALREAEIRAARKGRSI